MAKSKIAAPAPTMQVKIWAPFKIYFDAPAASVSAANDTGAFDVLPHHQNFITLLKPGEMVVRRSGAPDYRLNIGRGVMHVKADQVIVFIDV